MNRRTAGLISVVMAAGLLVVGLWPFAFRPPNRAGWLKERPGLSFQPDSIAYDPESAGWSAGGLPDQPAAFTVELWLEPGRMPATDVFDILSIDDGGFPSGIILCQWQAQLLFRVRDRAHARGFREVGPDGVLIEQTPCFITVTTDPSGTVFYLNGSLASRFPFLWCPAHGLTAVWSWEMPPPANIPGREMCLAWPSTIELWTQPRSRNITHHGPAIRRNIWRLNPASRRCIFSTKEADRGRKISPPTGIAC